MSDDRGVVFNIQRFSIHDGPGIRTTVFFKGCPLSCQWCSNPEGKNPKPQIILRHNKCIGCKSCLEACQEDAIRLEFEHENCRPFINWEDCTQCLKCTQKCPSGAISTSGKDISLEEIITHATADRAFYQNSGGGVTASGGEPLYQWKFVKEMFESLQAKGIHTALDTCGYAPWEVLKEVVSYTDLVLYDLKHMNGERHRELTGKNNSLIIANAERIAKRVETWFRIPLIPGFNDTKENIEEVAEFALALEVKKISILGFHELGKHKYEQIGNKYELEIAKKTSDAWITSICELVKSYDLEATVNA